jgi:hypothetical protein
MTVLNIIETAYRATLEEQDDPIVWLMHAMKGAGADLAVLLRGNAVNYLVEGQEAPRLIFGERRQRHGPRLAESVAGLLAKGVPVFVVEDDLEDRGLATGDLIAGSTRVRRRDLAGLVERHDQVWHW